ncbi:MAG: ATP-binding protein [Planctomycetota bacterium]|nr:ATP-binding protein [Planctomycetota bacterium]
MKLLIAEDDTTTRLVLGATLRRLGHSVTAVATGLQAWEAWQQDEYALLISDWMMPEMDGLALCRKIRAEPCAHYTYLILLTSLDGKGNYLDGMDSGADDMITKPFDEKLLEARLRVAERMLALHEALRIEAIAVQQRNAELEALNLRLAGTQSKLLQAEKMASVGLLAAGVAHEINNPIGFVHSNLGSLKRYVEEIFSVLGVYESLEHVLPVENPQIKELRALRQRVELDYLRNDTVELLAETLNGVSRVKKIVQDLQDFTQSDETHWQRVGLQESLDSAINMIAHEIQCKADLIKDYGTVPPVQCLPVQLNQVFMNLLMNAVQSIDGRGTINVRTGCENDTAWITISDSGCGIAPANLQRIFDPFFTTKPVGVGTGLGLWMTYTIVEKHAGSIEVESELGRGSTFTIRLPFNRGSMDLRGEAQC